MAREDSNATRADEGCWKVLRRRNERRRNRVSFFFGFVLVFACLFVCFALF